MLRFHHKILLFSFILVSSVQIDAQISSWTNRLYVETNYHYGFVTPHHKAIEYFVNDHLRGIECRLGLYTDGSKQWHKLYNYPKIGIGYVHSNLGNDEVFGQMNALFFFVDGNFMNENRRFNIGNRLGFGAAYVNKKYDLRNNYFDIAISTHVNVYINYSLDCQAKITDKLLVRAGTGFTHISNGSFSQPNKGLNMLTFFGGLNYRFYEAEKYKLVYHSDTMNDTKNSFMIMAAVGWKQVSRKYSDRYTIPTVSVEYSRRISAKSRLGFALCGYYDTSIKKQMEFDDLDYSSSDIIRVTWHLSYELCMGKVSYVFQPGIYLINAYKKDGNISNRMCVRYHINNQLTAGLTIKAHWVSVADFMEWGLGYRF